MGQAPQHRGSMMNIIIAFIVSYTVFSCLRMFIKGARNK